MRYKPPCISRSGHIKRLLELLYGGGASVCFEREYGHLDEEIRFIAVTLVGTLGGLALLLAAIGLYGVMSYVVSQSTRELGLRMALGADASNLLRLVMSRGLALTGGGVLLGYLHHAAATQRQHSGRRALQT